MVNKPDHYLQLDRDTQRAVDRAVSNAKERVSFTSLRCGVGKIDVTPIGSGRFGWELRSDDGLPLAEGIR